MSRIYAELLDREPDDEGLDYWSNMLDGGLSLVDVIWSFLQSEEFREENPTNPTVTGYYTAFLGRSPTSDESSYWTARIAADPREEAVLIASLLGSSEYEATLIPADSPSPYVWHSKEFTLPAPVSFSACKAVMNGSASISIYGDGELIVEESVETNGLEERYFRLPQSGRYLRFSVKIEGAAQVRSVKVARSFAEMRNA
jgi:hypothetical protein